MDREMIETPFIEYNEAPHGGIHIPVNDLTDPVARRSLWRVYSFMTAVTDSLTHTSYVSEKSQRFISEKGDIF